MRLSLLAAVALCASSIAAHADTISTFLARGTFSDGATLGGTINVDTTTGTITSGALTTSSPIAGSFATLYPVQGYNSTYADYSFFLETSSSSGVYLSFLLPETSLVNYGGSSIVGNSMPSSTGYNSGYVGSSSISLVSGAFTAAPISVTPEPSSLALLSTGALGMAGLIRKRYMSA